MSLRTHILAGSKWPFWLLLAAWICANSPQVAVYAVLTWMAEARTFSHQRDLSREVAHLLVGESAPGRAEEALARAQSAGQDAGSKRAGLPLPASVVVKKLDLAAEDVTAAPRPAERANFGWGREGGFGARRSTSPPHEPPRA